MIRLACRYNKAWCIKKFLTIVLLITSFSVQSQSMLELRDDTTDVFIGEVNGYTLTYDCHDCRTSVSVGITVNYKTKKGKQRLFCQEIFDFYVDDVAIIKLQGENFIYIGSTHTYGHSQGYLYFLNTKSMKAYNVPIEASGFKLPDSVHYHKYFELTRNENNKLGFGASLRDESGRQGSISAEYTLKKIKENQYRLISSKPSWGMDEAYE